jgi:hypothetical protein
MVETPGPQDCAADGTPHVLPSPSIAGTAPVLSQSEVDPGRLSVD